MGGRAGFVGRSYRGRGGGRGEDDRALRAGGGSNKFPPQKYFLCFYIDNLEHVYFLGLVCCNHQFAENKIVFFL